QTMSLIEGFRLLSVSPNKTVEVLRNVKSLEEDADDLYRNTELKLLESSTDLLTTMLIKDVIDRLEDSADAMLRIANSLYYISYLRS
ncbi:MAG: phosphate transport regulator, partial [Sulfolobaceae archaeon]|nr:phosphate transport regulator [Sulfolobales archaeon]